MKLYYVDPSVEGINLTTGEGSKADINDEYIFSSFPKAKKRAIALLTQRIADTKEQLKALRSTKSLE